MEGEIIMKSETRAKSKKKKLTSKVILGLLIALSVFVYINRYDVLPYLTTGRPILTDKIDVEISSNAEWFDDYYTIEYIDERTIAIGEPRYWQLNYNYLILGNEKAILFDSGPGLRDISRVVKALTDLPVISMASHYHYDHIGNIDEFDYVYLAGNQIENQELSKDNTLRPTKDSFLGHLEGIESKEFKVSKIVEDGENIELGNRNLKVIYAPGHAYNSIVLYDDDSRQLFSGDFIIKGEHSVNTILAPDCSAEEYKSSIKKLLDIVGQDIPIYGGHNTIDCNVPITSNKDLIDLYHFLSREDIKQGIIPKIKTINENIRIMY